MKILSKPLKTILIFILTVSSSFVYGNDTQRSFPLKNYPQDPNHFFDKNSSTYNSELFDSKFMSEKVKDYQEHLYGKLSPWSDSYIKTILNRSEPSDLKTIEMELFSSLKQNCDTDFSNSFGANLQAYPCVWFDKILKNMHLEQLNLPIKYKVHNRAIATANIFARGLPTHEPLFANPKMPGEGYPFDYLQVSAIWIGTPLYVLAHTNDKLWSLVITSSAVIGWVPSNSIALTERNFVSKYLDYVKKHGLRIITHTESTIRTIPDNSALMTSYIGSIFPASSANINQIMIPMRRSNGFANLQSAIVDIQNVNIFPLSPTPKNFVAIMNELKGRTYGWSGMYFYNDCSQELQNIFITFGYWLPRFSVEQVKVGKIEDLSNLNTQDRLRKLSVDAQPLVTLVYIKGHIMLYVGNYDYFGNLTPTIYNNMWGLRPLDDSYRAIIGRASFLPLFDDYLYPEDKHLVSVANNPQKPIFKLSFLNELPSNSSGKLENTIDLHNMIFALPN